MVDLPLSLTAIFYPLLKGFKGKLLRSVVCGVRCVVCGVWRVVCGVWCVVCGVRCVVCGVWCVVCDVLSISIFSPTLFLGLFSMFMQNMHFPETD